MASQYFSDFNQPSINGNIAQRILANEILRGVTQDVLETNNEGITQRFSNQTNGAEIRITQFMPFNLEARELGAGLNGENFDTQTALQANTNGVGVQVITVINRNIDIPQVTTDMLPISFLDNCMKNLKMDINNNINAMTIGGKMVATFNNIANGHDTFKEITLATATGNDIRNALMEMNAKLDEGDTANGISYFPDNDRCFVFRTSFIPKLFNGGILTLGGANHAYEMLAMGGISPNAKQDVRTGYVGEFEGSPVYKASPLIWNLAAKYAGVPVWSISDVYGYISSGYANVRALAQEEQVKIIDSPNGAGVRLQPNFRMGFKSLYPLGNVFLVESNFVNPSNGSLSLIGPASRTISSVTTLATVSLATGTTSATWSASDKKWKATLPSGSTSTGAISATATAGNVAKVILPSAIGNLSNGDVVDTQIKVIAEDGTTASYTLEITVSTN